jgi:hypothetical protein
VRAVVMMASDVWQRRFEPARWRWWVKRAFDVSSWLVVRAVGHLPARRIRIGTADEARTYWTQLHRGIADDRWVGLDGRDYHAGLVDIGVPVLHVLSEGDRFYACPRSALNFTSTLPHRQVLILGRDDAPADLRDYRPGHMQLATSPASAGAWWAVARWIARETAS